MARKTIREKLRTLKRKFPLRNRDGFLHSKKSDLNRRYTTILVYSLIHSEQKGFSLFIWNPHRKEKNWNWREWNKWLNQEGLDILSQDVMTAINIKRGDNWIYQRIIGFSGSEYMPRSLHIVGERKTAIYQKVSGEGENALYRRVNKSKRKGRNKADGKK